MNKNKNGSDIKLDISRGVVSFPNQGDRKIFSKKLNDTLEIIDEIGESPQKERLPLFDEVKGLFSLHIASKTKKLDSVEIDYYGKNEHRHSTYKNRYNQQVCLLIALLNTKNRQLPIESAYKILQDMERCYHKPKSIYAPRDEQVHQVIKNIRKRVGFHHKELYFKKRSSIIGLTALK